MNFMNCLAWHCKNKAYPGTTLRFHSLPKDPKLRKEWLCNLLPKKYKYDSWEAYVVVCGDHFKPEDYDECKRLVEGAVPVNKALPAQKYRRVDKEISENIEEQQQFVVLEVDDDEDVPETIRGIVDDWDGPDNPTVTTRVAASDIVMISDDENEMKNDDLDVPETIKACRVCLAVDGKLFHLQSWKHRRMYTEVTGLAMTANDYFPHFLCWECAGRVRAAARFRAKAHKSRHLLMKMSNHGKITMNRVRSIKRHGNILTSQLSKKYINSDEYISINEVSFEEINDIMMTHETVKESVEENIDKDVFQDIFDVEDRLDVLCDENDLISDNPLIDIDLTQTHTDIFTNVGTNDTVVGVDDVQENGAGGENNNVGEELSKGLNTRTPKECKQVPEYMKHFTVTTLTKEEELEMLKRKILYAPYKCELCRRGYLVQSIYETHALKHTEKYGEFECDICKIRKPTDKAILTHHRACHGWKYSCKHNGCSYVTLNKRRARDHYKNHTSEKFECPHCSKKYYHGNGRRSLQYHMRKTHLCVIPCELCGETFLNHSGKKCHQRVVHNIDKDESLQTLLAGPYCALCDVTFSSRAAHDTHLTKSSRHNDHDSDNLSSNCRLKRTNPRDLACEYCGATFRRKGGISSHKKTIHSFDMEETPLEGPHCAVCDVTFASRAAHDTHLAQSSRHNNDKTSQTPKQHVPPKVQYPKRYRYHKKYDGKPPETIYVTVTCEQCNQTFPSIPMYANHFKNEHPGQTRTQHTSGISAGYKYMCEHCGKKYQSISNLEDHMSLHTGEHFECNDCGKRFSKRSLLATHIGRIHSAKRRIYKCTVCPKRFMNFTSRLRHVKIRHMNLKPYECDLCGVRFIVPSLLRAHVNHVHNRVPWPKRKRHVRTEH